MTTPLHDLSELIPEHIIPPAACRDMLEELEDVVDKVTDDHGYVDPFFRLVTVDEEKQQYRFSVELPRDQVRDVEVTYQDGGVRVAGWRAAARTSDGRFTFFQDSFRRFIPLPHNADPHSIQAEHDHDTLVIVVAKDSELCSTVAVKQL